MAYVDSLKTARDNLAAELEDETTRRLALTAAGKPPPTTYSANGRSVSWNEYLATMVGQIKALDDAVIAADEPYEYHLRGYSG